MQTCPAGGVVHPFLQFEFYCILAMCCKLCPKSQTYATSLQTMPSGLIARSLSCRLSRMVARPVKMVPVNRNNADVLFSKCFFFLQFWPTKSCLSRIEEHLNPRSSNFQAKTMEEWNYRIFCDQIGFSLAFVHKVQFNVCQSRTHPIHIFIYTRPCWNCVLYILRGPD